ATGTGFPTTNVERIALAVRAGEPGIVYAMVSDANGALLGVYRLGGISGTWKKIANPPAVLPTSNGSSQGDYDLAIAVDPQDSDIAYFGGSYVDPLPYSGSVSRCELQATGSGFKFKNGTSIGTYAHAAVHTCFHTPWYYD